MKLKAIYFFAACLFLSTFSFAQTKEVNEEKIYEYTELTEKPEFKDGDLLSFICKKIIYPAKAVEQKMEGTVHVKFVISKEGDVVDVETVRPLNPFLDAEAIRVIKLSPQWEPGKYKGKYVPVAHTAAVKFALS